MDDVPATSELADGWIREGRVIAVEPAIISVRMPALASGSLVQIRASNGSLVHAAVRAAAGDIVRCHPVTNHAAVVVGCEAWSDQRRLAAFVGPALLGNVVDAWGRGHDTSGRGIVQPLPTRPVPLPSRGRVTRPLRTGIVALDALLGLGHGQRIAIMAGAGIGKTTLLNDVLAGADADAFVLAMVGERAKDALEAIDRVHQSDRWLRSTVVWAPADGPALERWAAVQTATAQAEWLCERGLDVVLAVDSLTRAAFAWRESALAAGEPPAHRGFPPSLTAALASVVERAGPRVTGTITALYVVLVDGDDPFEPVTDTLRGLLDGHIVLSRKLADAGKFPAIDVLRSISRTMPATHSAEQLADAAVLRRALATLEDAEDLFAIGAYRPGGDPWLDACVDVSAEIAALLYNRHGSAERVRSLAGVAAALRARSGPVPLSA